MTICIPVSKSFTYNGIREIYQNAYGAERLIKVKDEVPFVKDIQNRHGVELGGFAFETNPNRIIICVTIDNLLKGAATQCLRKYR
jgi:N-acetyl-gamma-glutamyl-phosphate reductase / acetylglutamate kinase